MMDVQLHHSGVYNCIVSNKFERIITSVQLVVWPYGI